MYGVRCIIVVKPPTATSITGEVVARIIPLKRNKKKNERKMETNERSDRARVRTMAVTVKFKSAEIYNGRCVAGRAL